MKRILITFLALWSIAYGQAGYAPFKGLAEGGRRISYQDSVAAEYDSSVLRSVAAYGMLANVYDTRGKFLNTYKKLLTGSTIAGNAVSRGKVRLRIAGFGDSVGGYLFTPFSDKLISMFGWGGAIMTGSGTGGGTIHSNTNETTYWFNGLWGEINGSGSLTYLYGGGRIQATQLKIYYIKESGAGSFQVQTDNGTGYVDEGSVVDCDNGGSAVSDIITINKTIGAYGVRINQVSGNVKIIMVVGINEPSDYDGVTVLQMNVGGLGWIEANATSKAITRPVFTDLGIDLAMVEFKETGSIYNTFKQWVDSFSAASPTTDWVLIGSTPQLNNNDQNKADNQGLRRVAFEKGWLYFDGYSPFISYNRMDSLDWEGDGLHTAHATGFYKAMMLWRIIGIEDVLMFGRYAGTDPSGDEVFQRNAGIKFTVNNNNSYVARLRPSSTSPDFYIDVQRWLALRNISGTMLTHYDPNTGWLIDQNQTVRGFGWASNGMIMKANDSLIDFWRATNRQYKMNINARTGMFDSLYVGTGIGTNGLFPSASALAEFNSTTKGVLLPRMTQTQMNAISSPANGLVIWNTDSVRLFSYNNPGGWRGLRYTNEADTVNMSSKAYRQKGIDSLAALFSQSSYTPTLSNAGNAASYSVNSAFWTRQGVYVTVYMNLSITATSAAATAVDIELPIPSNFTSSSDAIGSGSFDMSSGAGAVIVKGIAVSDVVQLQYTPDNTSAKEVNITFRYIKK